MKFTVYFKIIPTHAGLKRNKMADELEILKVKSREYKHFDLTES